MDELTLSIMQLDTEQMAHLLKSGAAVNIVDDGHTPLQWAASAGNHDAVKALLQHGADPNLSGEPNSTTALHFAADVSAEMVELLCSAGAQPNSRNDIGMTPVMVAAKFGRLDIVKLLVKYGALLDVYDNHIRGPLHWSTIGGDHPELNSYLIEAGADPLAKTDYGKSYLDLLRRQNRGSERSPD
jgi:ankyrin repeat protein